MAKLLNQKEQANDRLKEEISEFMKKKNKQLLLKNLMQKSLKIFQFQKKKKF